LDYADELILEPAGTLAGIVENGEGRPISRELVTESDRTGPLHILTYNGWEGNRQYYIFSNIATVSNEGSFSFGSLPAGDYKLPVDGRSTTVSLARGEQRTDLEIDGSALHGHRWRG